MDKELYLSSGKEKKGIYEFKGQYLLTEPRVTWYGQWELLNYDRLEGSQQKWGWDKFIPSNQTLKIH